MTGRPVLWAVIGWIGLPTVLAVVVGLLFGLVLLGGLADWEQQQRDATACDQPAMSTNPQSDTSTTAAAEPPTGDAATFIAAIAEQESGDNYSAVGIVTRTGDRAYGKYQIMGANLASWGRMYVGRPVTISEFLASPALQDQIAHGHLAHLLKTHGVRGAAAAWYSGNPNKHMDMKSQRGGPPIKQYVDEVIGHMGNPQTGTVEVRTADQQTTTPACTPNTQNAALTGEPGSAQHVHPEVDLSQHGTPGKWGGHANGQIPLPLLCPIPNTPSVVAPKDETGLLRCDAAKALVAMGQAYAADLGKPIAVGNGYRNLRKQQGMAGNPLAAVPGTSNHGWALAVDYSGGIQSFGTREHKWMQARAGEFGWCHPKWARAGGSKPEAWHWEFGKC